MSERPSPLRPFGCAAEDLELDFGCGDRPALVTALLAACATPPDGTHWCRRPVGERIGALLGLLRESDGRDSIALALRCTACDAPLEFELPHAALSGLSAAADPIEVPRAGCEPLTLRVPTGDDLRAWRERRPATRAQAVQAMLASLRVAGEPRPGDDALAADALAGADPLVAFSAACTCPGCGNTMEQEIDLEGLALMRLASRQRALLCEVHALASRYGWTEHEILALTPARRAKYLALIEDVA
jgi:hypothetical protein